MENDDPEEFSEAMSSQEIETSSTPLTVSSTSMLIPESVVENVVLTSIVETEDEEEKTEIPLADTEMPSFGLVQFSNVDTNAMKDDPVEVIKGDKESQEMEIGAQSIIKEEEVDSCEQNNMVQIVTSGEETVIPQQFIILTQSVGGGALTQVEMPEFVAQKYIQIEGADGQTYLLAVNDNNTINMLEAAPVQTIQTPTPVTFPSKTTKSERKRGLPSTSKALHTQPTPSSSSSLTSPASSSSTSTSSSSTSSSPVSSRAKVTNTESINQAWFTTRDDKNALHKEGHQWKQGQWTKEEVEILKTNITNYCKDHGIKDAAEVIFEMSKDERKDFYRTIAWGIQRPLFSVYRRVTRMYDQKNHRGKYSHAEMKTLRGLRAQHGNDWSAIGLALGRSASSVKDKCRLMKDNCNSGKWYPDEEVRLAAAVYEMTGVKPSESITTGLSWATVADHVGSRSEKQCRTKWLNYLNWKQQGGSDWTRDDDGILIDKVSKLNATNDSEIDWNTLAKDWSSVRSPQWLRGKWWALKRHIPEYNTLSYPELITSMKQSLSWGIKPKSGMRPVKMDLKNQQEMPAGASGFLKNCVPVSMTDPEGSGLSLSYCPSDEESYQYEVLQQWTPQVISQVTQQSSSALGGGQVINGTPLIIQSIASLTDTASGQPQQQQVIISTSSLCGPGGGSGDEEGKGDSNQTSPLHIIPDSINQPEQDMGVLTDSDNLHDATGIAMSTFDPGEGQEIIAVSDYAAQSDVSNDGHMMSHDVFETVTSESGSDLVMGVTSPTRPNSLMTSLKDPILMASSDVECDKHQSTLSDEHNEMIGDSHTL